MVVNGRVYETYGLINEKDKKDLNVEYKLIIGNLFWGCFLVQTVFAPIYFFGFSLFEPVRLK